MTLDGLLVCARAWPTRPAIAARRFCVQRGLDTAHVEERLAPIASDGFLSLVSRGGLSSERMESRGVGNVRGAPIGTRVTISECVSQVGHNLLLCHHIFIT
jgi:hypothetical protein